MKENLFMYLVMALAIYDRSVDWFARRSLNSSLARPSLHLPPFKYTL
jgi:hypothetical protein